MTSVFGKKSTHNYIDNHFFFFFFFESVMLSTYVHTLKTTYILQSTNHDPLSELYLGETEGIECT